MPFKACAPRALPPDFAPPLWESNGPFPSAARPPPANPAPEGRPRPRGSGSIRGPGSTRRGGVAGDPGDGGRGARIGGLWAAAVRPGILKLLPTVAAAAAQSPSPSQIPNAHTQDAGDSAAGSALGACWRQLPALLAAGRAGRRSAGHLAPQN